jgi:hypothetical protein
LICFKATISFVAKRGKVVRTLERHDVTSDKIAQKRTYQDLWLSIRPHTSLRRASQASHSSHRPICIQK